MKTDDLMIFAPLLPLLAFLAWGIWKQRKNPRLLFAIVGGLALTMVGVGVGMGGVILATTAAAGLVLIAALVWFLSRALR